jgi:hypothetical protein
LEGVRLHFAKLAVKGYAVCSRHLFYCRLETGTGQGSQAKKGIECRVCKEIQRSRWLDGVCRCHPGGETAIGLIRATPITADLPNEVR